MSERLPMSTRSASLCWATPSVVSRSSSAAIADCGYYTLNDRLINILYDVFGQSFTADEITQDANQLAAERLKCGPDGLL